MTKIDVEYLEHKAIDEANKANAFILSDNKQIPKAPNLPEHQQDSMDESFEDVKFLASFIGCNIFEISQPKSEHLLYTKGRGCNAKGFYSSDGFNVLKGSVISQTMVPSFNWKEKREKMIKDYTANENCVLVLTSDKKFSIGIVQLEGERDVELTLLFYNLDAIIAVGYRVNRLRFGLPMRLCG